MVINADALNWYIREAVFDRLDPQDAVELMREDDPDDNKLKRLYEQRAAQQFRLDGLIDDYATGLLSRAELSRAKEEAQNELSRIDGEIELLRDRKNQTGQLGGRESLKQAWEAHADTGWRSALISVAVERVEVFPGVRKPFVDVDGVTMRFDKERVKIIWRKGDSAATSAA